jgi:hypothetical protein
MSSGCVAVYSDSFVTKFSKKLQRPIILFPDDAGADISSACAKIHQTTRRHTCKL